MEKNFIKASRECCSREHHVNAPYMRRSFLLDFAVEEAEISICGLGFYRLFINGREITKGYLAPYNNNPDHYCYYDTYDLKQFLKTGENVIGIMLGNGFLNAFCGSVWDLDKADCKSAPMVALELQVKGAGRELFLSADETFKVHPSPITFDEMRMGEWYDAGLEIPGWNMSGFDDSTWEHAIRAEKPRGVFKKCEAEPIRVEKVLKPVAITKQDNGYVYDFGENTAGLTKLTITAKPGQVISLRHWDVLENNEFVIESMGFGGEVFPDYFDYVQRTVYTARGGEKESYVPSFAYYGFRYVLVQGITEEQATDELLEYLVMHSELKQIGDFVCSDETVNTLMEMVKRTDLSNFYYFPTDCPHREKNGWTGDASVSSDHMTLLYDTEASFREWLHNIRSSQYPDGALPGIVPTYGWGVKDVHGSVWSGPAWDSVLFNLPYMLYKYRGCTEVIRENAHAMVRYLEYVLTKRREDGLIGYGLGDWIPVGKRAKDYDAPLELTDSIMVMDIAAKAARMLAAIGHEHTARFAQGVSEDMRKTIREKLLDKDTMEMAGKCQSSQALALYYGVFDEKEKPKAYENLIRYIHEKGDSFDCGFLGMHVIFHVLSDCGEGELAYHMITKKEYPSYAHVIACGDTTFTEAFHPKREKPRGRSRNHHFQVDIFRWFMTRVAGLDIVDSTHVEIKPDYIRELTYASARYELPSGTVRVLWEKKEEGYVLSVCCPDDMKCSFELPKGVKTILYLQESEG